MYIGSLPGHNGELVDERLDAMLLFPDVLAHGCHRVAQLRHSVAVAGRRHTAGV